MNYLLDTHSFLWWCANDSRLSSQAIEVIADIENNIFLSVVSAWEISIKSRIGKLPLPEAPEVFISNMLKLHSFYILPISMTHALADYHLANHHNDPFDRLLISQSITEDFILITNDSKILNYELKTFW